MKSFQFYTVSQPSWTTFSTLTNSTWKNSTSNLPTLTISSTLSSPLWLWAWLPRQKKENSWRDGSFCTTLRHVQQFWRISLQSTRQSSDHGHCPKNTWEYQLKNFPRSAWSSSTFKSSNATTKPSSHSFCTSTNKNNQSGAKSSQSCNPCTTDSLSKSQISTWNSGSESAKTSLTHKAKSRPLHKKPNSLWKSLRPSLSTTSQCIS